MFEAVQKEIAVRSGAPPATHSDRELAFIGDPLYDAELKLYLASCLPREVLGVSGVRLLSLERIAGEIAPGVSPGGHLHRFDYVPIATSIGGNAVVVHAWADRRAKVYWADHEGWGDDSLGYQDRATGEWIYLPAYSPENVERALVPLSRDLGSFLLALVRDELTERLDSLD